MNNNYIEYPKTKIVPYRGFANEEKIIIRGHIFKKHRVKDVKEHHRHFYNLKQAIRRYRLSPMKYSEARISVNGQSGKVSTDKRGYFTAEFKNKGLPRGWHKYKIHYDNFPVFTGELYHPLQSSTAVISDIDDTVLISHSTKFHKKLNLVLFRNAHSRKPIPLIKDWYGHLHELNEQINPKDFFYVSNSEWNLYDFIADFFEVNRLPKGIFFLQNLKKGLKDILNTGRVDSEHKMRTIRFLLEFYPKKPFILVGDNGQKDIDIYSHICEEYPTRIKGVMIRKLTYIKEKNRLNKMHSRLKELDIPFASYH